MTHAPEGNLMLKFLKSVILQTFNYAFILPFDDLPLNMSLKTQS